MEGNSKERDYRDECECVEVEREFNLGKRKCGIVLVTAQLEDTAAHMVALSILLLNPRKIKSLFTVPVLAAWFYDVMRKSGGY